MVADAAADVAAVIIVVVITAVVATSQLKEMERNARHAQEK